VAGGTDVNNNSSSLAGILRLKEAERVGYGFDLPEAVVAPNAPKKSTTKSAIEIAA
jgi:hypothetical protein